MADSAAFTVGSNFVIPGGGVFNSPAVVSGMAGPLTALTVRLNLLSHPHMLDLSVLLVAPDGVHNLVLYSRNSGQVQTASNATFEFMDHPTLDLNVLAPFDTTSVSGSDFLLGIQLNHPASSGSATLASAFSGIDPNGTWTLYIRDFFAVDGGATLDTWTLNLVTNVAPVISAPGLLTVNSGSSLTFSAAKGNLPTSLDPDVVSDMADFHFSVEHGLIDAGLGPSPQASGGFTGFTDILGAVFEGAVYTPNPGFSGVDHLTITMTDEGGPNGLGDLTVTKTIDIAVYDHPAATSGDDTFTAKGWQKIDGGAGKDTIIFDFALTQAEVVYDDNIVTIYGPSTRTILTGFEKFVFNDGTVDNADGNALVNDLFYYSKYHDVWAEHVDPDKHYAEFGWHEGRTPNAIFNPEYYLSTYADVKAAGVNPLQHYHDFGWKEGRSASPAFNTHGYLAAYPDVAAAHIDPLEHFLMFGQQEGRHALFL